MKFREERLDSSSLTRVSDTKTRHMGVKGWITETHWMTMKDPKSKESTLYFFLMKREVLKLLYFIDFEDTEW